MTRYLRLLTRYYIHRLLWLPVLLSCTLVASAQVSIQQYQNPYYQNFNTLAATGNNNTVLPAGWLFKETGSGSNLFYSACDGPYAGGNTYSFGIVGTTERALGTILTGSVTSTIGARFINHTGGIITRFTIEYTGEQWSLGFAGRNDRMDFQFSTDATALNTGTWTDFDVLDFMGPVRTGTTGALNGNLPENRTYITAMIGGLNLVPGAVFWIKWVDMPADMNDDGLAIDDFSITASDPCPIAISSFAPDSGPVNTAIVITGDHFNDVVQVLVNGSQASFELVDNSTIKAVIPAGATSGRISCITNCSAVSEGDFTVSATNCRSSAGLILSELCDPEMAYETDRFIEIYNPTTLPIDLNGWSVRAIPNNLIGTECDDYVMCWDLSGSINPGQALTCGYTDAVSVTHDFTNQEWYAGSAINGACYLWNGQWRDGAALYHGTDRVDGIMREQSSSDWYSNSSLVRNSDICTPDSSSSYLEWTVTETVDHAGTAPATPHQHSTICNLSVLPEITEQPVSKQACVGASVSFNVEVVDGLPPLQYQWKVCTGTVWENVIDGPDYTGAGTATLQLFNIPVAFNNYQYYCIITNSDGDCYVISNAAQLTVLNVPGPISNAIWHQ